MDHQDNSYITFVYGGLKYWFAFDPSTNSLKLRFLYNHESGLAIPQEFAKDGAWNIVNKLKENV